MGKNCFKMETDLVLPYIWFLSQGKNVTKMKTSDLYFSKRDQYTVCLPFVKRLNLFILNF